MNGLQFATVSHLHIVNHRTVVFTIDLNSHVHLRDLGIVTEAMTEFVAKYPRVDTWSAEVVDSWLHITVVGKIRPVEVEI